MSQPPLVIALETDVFFAARIEGTVKNAGARPLIVGDGDGLWQAIGLWPELVIVDLASEGWEEPIRRAKNLPHTRAIPVLAFGSHTDRTALQVARETGCDYTWLRSRLVAELPDLLEDVLHPPVRWLDGWDAPPPPALCRGAEQFNAQEYWECHETLERLWVAESRPIRDFYQGVLQVGVAFHHLKQGRYEGAIKMLRRSLPRLRGLPDTCQGVAVAELVRAARAVHDRTIALGSERIYEFDLASLPRLHIQGCSDITG